MFDERPEIQERLENGVVIWLTTVSPAGQPQTSPVWFLVAEGTIVVYSMAGTPRTRNIRSNDKVVLNLNSSDSGGSLVIIEGRAEIVSDGVPADGEPAYLAKYESEMATWDMTVESFTRDYPIRIHIHPTRLRAS